MERFEIMAALKALDEQDREIEKRLDKALIGTSVYVDPKDVQNRILKKGRAR